MNFKKKWRRKEKFKMINILKKRKVNMKMDNNRCFMKKLMKNSREKSKKRR